MTRARKLAMILGGLGLVLLLLILALDLSYPMPLFRVLLLVGLLLVFLSAALHLASQASDIFTLFRGKHYAAALIVTVLFIVTVLRFFR